MEDIIIQLIVSGSGVIVSIVAVVVILARKLGPVPTKEQMVNR